METNEFEQIAKDLRTAGFTDVHLAKLCGCSKQNIGKIRHGTAKTVRYDIGLRLTKLHEAIQ